jgi:hypothetical protein
MIVNFIVVPNKNADVINLKETEYQKNYRYKNF